MCSKADGTLPTATYLFEPDVKCCAFLPWLPNFLVGRILRDGDPSPVAQAGRRSVEARVAARVGVTPLGLDRPPLRDLHLRHALDAFGHSRALRCPHYVDEDGGLCGIWRHREATCATWFCRFERGRVGFDLWQQVKALLQEVERDLALRCALDAGVDPALLARLLPQDDAPAQAGRPWQELEGAPDPAVYAAAWGPWEGREVELYRACAALTDGLGWDDVLARSGPRVAARAAAVRAAYDRQVDERLPGRLRAGAFQVAATRRDGGLRAVTYSPFDAIDLPARLVALLPAFDGRPTDEVLDALRRDHGVELDAGFLRQLIDWGVLSGE
ncbi:MAG: hypothetical protein M9894_18860 [Planctomycetes bacterium]|nr:hypothetical protein [Planctomycetota bacterium]